MKGFTVYASNRMEELVRGLAEVVQLPSPDPLEQEVIVIQSRGMQRWLVQELARLTKGKGFANARFPFPNAIVDEVLSAVLGATPRADLFAPELLTWRIMRHLPSRLSAPAFDILRNYLGDEPSGLKGIQLASRIADTFDQYTLFRPEMVLGWERKRNEADWQAELWCDLANEHPGAHRAARREAFDEAMKTNAPLKGAFPSRMSIFGISSMPAFHLDVFAALSEHVDIHFFFLNPSEEYWGDIVSPRELAGWTMRRFKRRKSSVGDDDYRTVGHPLLGSWGKLGRDFSNLLIERLDGISTDGKVRFCPPGEDTLLAALQSDILTLRDAKTEAGGEASAKRHLASGDRSIRIHSVHSPIREIEVLQDQLLDLFNSDSDLKPHDVVVMSPDIEKYAPFIAAVFDSVPSLDPRHIPYTVADRPAGAENPVARAFMGVISLSGSRFGVSQVLELVESPAIGRRFGFGSADIETIQGWIRDTGIRWGADASDRTLHGVPPFAENSWKAGFDRLLLGYGMQGGPTTLFHDVLPHEGVEGGAAELLGRFFDFAWTLFRDVRKFDAIRTLPEWSDLLGGVLDRFVSQTEEDAENFQAVRACIVRLADVASITGFGVAVPVDVVRNVLDQVLGAERGPGGFLAKGVTFCEMLPMRSVPFKVVALVGMDNGAFPRQVRPPGFDKISKEPMAGDRSLPAEDRYIFLEALLSARKCLYISYVGRSVVDNSELPPSVLVSELIDSVDQGSALVIEHKLQAFSPAYFTPAGAGEASMHFSYSMENCDALQSREAARSREGKGDSANRRPFLSKPLAEQGGAWRHVSLNDLRRFFKSPAGYFLKERIDLILEDDGEGIDDEEPFEMNHLEQYKAKSEVIVEILAGRDLAPMGKAVRARGVLPPGLPGESAWVALCDAAAEVAEMVAPLLRAELPVPSVDVDLSVGEFRLSGRVDRCFSGGLLRYRPASIKPNDRVAAWIDHIALCATGAALGPCRLFGEVCDTSPGEIVYPVIKKEDAEAHLEALLSLFGRGLSEPLPLFPKSSFAYAKAFLTPSKAKKGKGADLTPRERAVKAAKAEWEGKFNHSGKTNPGEKDDPWFMLAFGEEFDAPRSDDFADVAVKVFGEILSAEEA